MHTIWKDEKLKFLPHLTALALIITNCMFFHTSQKLPLTPDASACRWGISRLRIAVMVRTPEGCTWQHHWWPSLGCPSLSAPGHRSQTPQSESKGSTEIWKQMEHHNLKAKGALRSESKGNITIWKQREHWDLKANGTSRSESKGNIMIWKQREHNGLNLVKTKGTPQPESKGNIMNWKQREHCALKAEGTSWSEGEGNTTTWKETEHDDLKAK